MNGANIIIEQGTQVADVYKKTKSGLPKQMRRTSFQARLGRRLDTITAKITDNAIRLSSQPTDMIRITAKRDQISQDLISRSLESCEIIPIIFPSFEKIPLRRLVMENNKAVLTPSLYQFNQEQYWTLYAPATVQLDEDDLLLRIIYDPYSDVENIVCLQITESLATIGYSSIIYIEYHATLYDEVLPDAVTNIIKEANDKREELDW